MTDLSRLGPSRDLGVARYVDQRGQFGRNHLDRVEARTYEGRSARDRASRPLQDRLQHGGGLRRELVQRTVAMTTGAEVDLGDDVRPELRGDVDQQRDVDAVALDERQLLEQLAPAGVLAAE